MKNLILITILWLVCTEYSHAQIKDPLYSKLPWNQCMNSYVNFYDYYSEFEIDPPYQAWYKVGTLTNCNKRTSLIFVQRNTNDSSWQKLEIPSQIARPPFVLFKLAYEVSDSTLRMVYFTSRKSKRWGDMKEACFDFKTNTWCQCGDHKESATYHNCNGKLEKKK